MVILETQADRRAIQTLPFCYLCGGNFVPLDETDRDHLPPKTIFHTDHRDPVPYPKDKKQFVALAALGKELCEFHLLESPKIDPNEIPYPETGSDTVEKIDHKDGRVYINATQYFGDVPELAWSFWIGGYQPARKWLKDRKGRKLKDEDIRHYQKIIVALAETDRIMREIDNVTQF